MFGWFKKKKETREELISLYPIAKDDPRIEKSLKECRYTGKRERNCSFNIIEGIKEIAEDVEIKLEIEPLALQKLLPVIVNFKGNWIIYVPSERQCVREGQKLSSPIKKFKNEEDAKKHLAKMRRESRKYAL